MSNDNMTGASNCEQGRQRLDRRKFIKYSIGAGTVAVLSGKFGAPRLLEATPARAIEVPAPALDKSNVVVVRSDSLFGAGEGPDRQKTEEMLTSGIRDLFGSDDAVAVWQTLFKPDDVVGIKVNCIAGPQLSSHPNVVAAIVSELKKVPIPEENIVIWDRTDRELTRAGYRINVDGPGLKCYGTDTVGYEENASAQGSFNGRLSKILTRKITALVNVPILKDHGGAGVTIAMKNHYGSFDNPRKHHKNQCDPYIADLNSLDEIKAKTRLVVCDATTAICNGGPRHRPGFAWKYSGLLLSQDPVALDTVGTRIIDERRVETGLPPLSEAGRYPRQLASAAERGLGNAEMKTIAMRTIMI